MNNPVIVMVSISDRVESLNRFLESQAKYIPNIPIFIHLQDPDERQRELKFPDILDVDMMVTNEPIGCHAARVLAQRKLKGQGFDSYINVDDDVTIMDTTNYQPAIEYAHEPGVGFVLTNWAPHQSVYEKRKPKMQDVMKPQIMVYQGGGMAYGEPVAELMRELDPVPARYDDIWPLTSYLNGYMNYRYSGSLTLHQTLRSGGMRGYMRSEPRPLLCWKWIDYKKIHGAKVGVDYAIPMDVDLREKAREEHRRNRVLNGWPMRNDKYAAHPKREAKW